MSQALVTANFPLPSVVGSLDAYISAVHRIPVLTTEEEQALAARTSNRTISPQPRSW